MHYRLNFGLKLTHLSDEIFPLDQLTNILANTFEMHRENFSCKHFSWYTSGFTNNSIYNDSIAVGFIGDFTNTKPTDEQFEELEAFIVEALRRKQLKSDYLIYGNRTDERDGKFLFDKLKKWSHCNGFL